MGVNLKKKYPSQVFFKKSLGRSSWVTQLVKHLTLNLGSGHDLPVLEFKPCMGLHAVTEEEPGWDSLSPSFSSSWMCPLSLSLSLLPSKINKLKKNKSLGKPKDNWVEKKKSSAAEVICSDTYSYSKQ